MNAITYQEEKNIDKTLLLNLYNNAGWVAYTSNIDELEKAINNSLYVLTAKSNGKLLGLIRIVGDGTTILYIQDILVHTDYKRKGIGTELIKRTLQKYASVRQKVLLTEDTEETRGFYESLGFESCDKGYLVSFVKLENKYDYP
mgnify:CR=1 FL=1